MDLKKHYESYRAAVLRDALDEGSWYAKQIKVGPTKTTVYDWLSGQVAMIKEAVSAGREEQYRFYLVQHQKAMIDLYEAMVKDYLWDYKNVTPQQVLDLIDEQGTNWFKFSQCTFRCKVTLKEDPRGDYSLPMLWTPRYTTAAMSFAASGGIVFDADELHLLSKHLDKAKAAFAAKTATPSVKFTDATDRVFIGCHPREINSDIKVQDWTAPLFNSVEN